MLDDFKVAFDTSAVRYGRAKERLQTILPERAPKPSYLAFNSATTVHFKSITRIFSICRGVPLRSPRRAGERPCPYLGLLRKHPVHDPKTGRNVFHVKQ